MAKFTYEGRPGVKLNKQQTEKVLTAHSLGMLSIGGRTWFEINLNSECPIGGCINQIVHNIPNIIPAYRKNQAVAHWFDTCYHSQWTVEEFLAAMRSANITEA